MAAAASASPAGTARQLGRLSQRRIMLNALLWLAKVDVPAKGVVDTITEADLTVNLDDKPPRK